MTVKNYTDCYKGGTVSINITELAPKWAFRLLIIGPSGSGKTNMLVDLLLNHIYYDNIYIYAKDLEEPLYLFLKEFFEKVKNIKGSELRAEFHDTLELPNIDTIDKKKQSLIIFDDFITEKDQSLIKDLFVRGRKKNISTIYLSQSYFDIPRIIRLNSQYFALFDISDKKELRSIADSHSTRVSFNEFQDLYREIMDEPFSFMVIDKVSPHLPLHLRKKWDGLLNKVL